jgi:hypothetical protein
VGVVVGAAQAGGYNEAPALALVGYMPYESSSWQVLRGLRFRVQVGLEVLATLPAQRALR